MRTIHLYFSVTFAHTTFPIYLRNLLRLICVHLKLYIMFYLSHPNMFDFVEKLKSIQTHNYLKVRAYLTELPLERQEKVSHENESLPG